MLISLDPIKLYAYGVNVEAINRALEKNAANLPAGKFHNEIPVTLDISLKDPQDFENLIIYQNTDGSGPIRLKDVATISLQPDRNTIVRVEGKPGLLIGIVKS